jgi:dUTP pyrophosphatase
MAMPIKVLLKQLDPTLKLPAYAYPGDAGLDLLAAADLLLLPGQRASVPTGIAIAIPEGYAGFVLPRSGLALRNGLSLVNTPGLIDSHYRGEICVIVINHDTSEPISINKGQRIAQLVILPTPVVELIPVTELDETTRSTKGFGSSGI